MLSIFSCASWPSVYLGKMSVQVLYPFFNWVVGFFCFLGLGGLFGFFFLMLSLISSLYILDVNPLSDVSFASIFSRSVGGLFHFVGSFLCCAKVF